MSGVNKFAGKCQGKIHHVVVAEEKSNAIVKEKYLTTEKVTTSKVVDKGNNNLGDMKEAVVTIHRKDLFNFEVQYKG